jgi:hypothetical protein
MRHIVALIYGHIDARDKMYIAQAIFQHNALCQFLLKGNGRCRFQIPFVQWCL